MTISEKKMRIVIDNYFKSECDVNTSIRQAFEKGFRIGVTKGECSQPKMGQWIKYGVPRCGEQHYKCTSCGYYINFGQWGELYTKEFKFCPNCGADMRGE